MFKGNVAGAWSRRKGSRAYSKLGSAISTGTDEGMLGKDSPRSPVQMFLRNERPFTSPTPAPRAFLRSPVHPLSPRDISAQMVPSPNPHVRRMSPTPMAQTGVMVMMPASPQQLTSQQLQQQQQQQQQGQQQMSVFTPQQQSQVQGLQSPPSQQTGGNNSLFDALDQNQDGVITRSEFNRAFGVSPAMLVGPASTPVVSTLVAPDPRTLVGSPPMMLVTPGAPSTTSQVATPLASPVRHPRGLSQSISSVQAVMGSPVLLPGAMTPLAGPAMSPQMEIRP